MAAIPKTKFFPIELGPENIPDKGWQEMVSLYKKLQKLLPRIRKTMTDHKKIRMYDDGKLFVGQITNKPPTFHPGAKDVDLGMQALKKTYPALHDLLQFTMCRDVVYYESIKLIPPHIGWTQTKKNKVARFVKNVDKRPKPAPSAKPARGPPGPRPQKWQGPGAGPRAAPRPAPSAGPAPRPRTAAGAGPAPRPRTAPGPRPAPGQRPNTHQGPPPGAKKEPPRAAIPKARGDLYKVLGDDITKESTTAAIVKAWQKMVLKHHPDKHGAANVANQPMWEKLKLAGKILRSKEHKQRYDKNGDEDVAWLKTHATNPYLVTLYTASEQQFAG